MSQEVTVRITVEPSGAATAAGGAATETSEPPAPIALDQLQLSGSAQVPTPVSLAELASLAAGGEAVAAGTPPPPLPIEQLQSTGAVGGAPAPLDLGAPSFEGTPPTPMSPEELAALEGAPEGDEGPAPESPRSKRSG